MPSRPKVLVTLQDFSESALKLLHDCDVDVWRDNFIMPREEFLMRIVGIHGLITEPNYEINEEVLDAAGPQLKVVSTRSVGYNHIDVKALKRRRVRLGVTAKVSSDAVAEFTLALLLACSRRLFEGRDTIAQGKWPKSLSFSWLNGRGLKNSVVGIIGLGRIGVEIAKRLVPFKVKEIVYTSRTEKPYAQTLNARRLTLNKLLQESDFVVLICELNDETYHLIGEEQLKMMKPTAILVNASRGAVIDQDALVKALKDGVIGGAALDVMTPEPLPPDHELVSLKNCCLAPHLGTAEFATREAMSEITAQNVVAALQGKPMPSEIK